MERSIYLSNTDIETAVAQYLEAVRPTTDGVGTERADIRGACGRVTARPVIARISAPNFNAAAMDGIMARSAATYTASEASPVELVRGADYEEINTGHPLRDPFDCVIMVEDLVPAGPDRVRITSPAAPWQHVRPIGEDIVAGEMVLPEQHTIRPVDIGAVLNSGVTEIEVYERVRVGIMPTGDEIKDCYDQLEPGQYFDTNSWTFRGIIEEWGGLPERIPPVPDQYEALRTALFHLLENNHIVIVNAGSSAGSMDFTADLIRDNGRLLFHGLAIRPGKPTILGLVRGKPVIGVPGYPGSAFLAFEEIVGPVFRILQRSRIPERPEVEATLSRRLVSSLKYKEYIRVKLGSVEGKRIATPLARGAGVTMSLVRADGLLVVPKQSEGFEAGETVRVRLTKDVSDIERTLVSIGSHDLLMDHIASLMEKAGGPAEPVFHLSSAHVGSMGGILALSRGEAHLAPIHLLDEATGRYNESFLARYLPGQTIALVKGVRREQGIMVAPGNPLAIRGIADLDRPDLRFVNRQKGSGTRLLTDYLLKEAGIDSATIRGYDRDMTTHMAVAAAVKNGTADAGVGVRSAAESMGLSFLPIGFEDYDFAIPERLMETPMVQRFLSVLRSDAFLMLLKELGGYEQAVRA